MDCKRPNRSEMRLCSDDGLIMNDTESRVENNFDIQRGCYAPDMKHLSQEVHFCQFGNRWARDGPQNHSMEP